MKRYILLLLVVSMGFASLAQIEPAYFDEYWQPCGKKHATYVRHAHPDNGLFRVEDHYADGGLFCVSYRTEVESNMVINREGSIIFYDKQGHKMREGNYLHGKRDGIWKYYDPKTGKVRNEIRYYEDSTMETADAPGMRTLDQRSGDDSASSNFRYTKNGIKVKQEGKKDALVYVEEMPTAGFNIPKYLSENITYPSFARKAGIEGRVIVKFVVDEDGGVANVSIAKGIGGGCDEEALRVVSEMPHWNPGYQNNQPVRVYFTLPITFKLK